MTTLRTEFKNVSGGVQGAVIVDETGKPKGIPVSDGDSVWLTEAEEILTANAPRRAEDNPFTNGAFIVLTRASEAANRRPIGSRDEAPTPVERLRRTETRLRGTPATSRRRSRAWSARRPRRSAPRRSPKATRRSAPARPARRSATPEVVRKGRGKTVRSDNPAAKPAAKEGVQHAVVVGQGGMQYKEADSG
jgi:hypothetical protein